MEGKTIQYQLREKAIEYKDQTAIIYSGNSITYSELDKTTNNLALYLLNKGIKPGDRIAVLNTNRFLTVIGILSCLKIRCVFVPIDDNLNKEEIQEYLTCAGIKFIVYQDYDAILCNDPVITSFNIEKGILETNHELQVLPEGQPKDDLYIYFTSGSTGTPNTILGQNSSLLHFLMWEKEYFGMNNTNTFSQLTPPSHDPYLREIFIPLLVGGILHIPNDPSILLRPRHLLKWLDVNAISVIHCTPSLLQILKHASPNKSNLVSLEIILIAGEALFSEQLEFWYSLYGQTVRFVNLYGPSETTLAKVFHEISEDSFKHEIIPLGKPISDTSIRIMDTSTIECEIGDIGEIVIFTRFLTKGYINNSDLQKDRFVSYNSEVGFKSGDLGKILPDGNLIIVGRINDQVKFLGRRINLNHIKNSVLQFPNIHNCEIIYHQTVDSQELLCFYEAEKELLIGDIKNHLLTKISKKSMPTSFIWKVNIPLSRTNKADRKQLLGDYLEKKKIKWDVNSASYNLDENRMISIWTNVFEDQEIYLNSNFFDLGGTSLTAVLLMVLIEDEFEIEKEPNILLDHPTLRDLLDVILNNSDINNEIDEYFTPYNTRGSNTPYILVPGIGVNGISFVHFADEMGENYPLFIPNIQNIRRSGDENYLRTIDDMAIELVQKIEYQFPHGSLIMGGFSLGSLVAFKASQLLQAKGRSPRILFMIDSYLMDYAGKPITFSYQIKLERKYVKKYLHISKMFKGLKKLSFFLERKSFDSKMRRYYRKEIPVSQEMNSKLKSRLYNFLLEGFRFSNYTNEIVLINADQEERWKQDLESWGWKNVVKDDIEVFSTQGSHFGEDSIFSSNNSVHIAKIIKRRLSAKNESV